MSVGSLIYYLATFNILDCIVDFRFRYTFFSQAMAAYSFWNAFIFPKSESPLPLHNQNMRKHISSQAYLRHIGLTALAQGKYLISVTSNWIIP